MKRERNLFLTGFMGTGKSQVGRIVARRLGLRFVDMDAEIEKLAGMTVADIFRRKGEADFRRMEVAMLEELCARSAQVIATGGGALLSPESQATAQAAGLVVCLRATPEEIARRLGPDEARPLLAGSDGVEARVRDLLRERGAAYAAIALQVDTTGKTPEQAAEEVIGLWRSETHRD